MATTFNMAGLKSALTGHESMIGFSSIGATHWECCHCKTWVSCEIGGHNYMLDSIDGTYPDHGGPGCAECLAVRCPKCGIRRCADCVYHDADGAPIETAGGRNLIADRFAPAGWGCCRCYATYFAHPTVDGRDPDPATHAMVTSILVSDDGDEYRAQEQIQHTCRNPNHHKHKHNKSNNEAHLHHPPCQFCVVLNRYGEPIGLMSDVRRGKEAIPAPPGPLFRHRLWAGRFARHARWLNRARAAALGGPLPTHAFDLLTLINRLRVVEAENERREVDEACERMRAWAVEVQTAALVEAGKRMARP